jgi:hypothetical protein
VPEVVLDRAGITPVVGELVAVLWLAVDEEREAGGLVEPTLANRAKFPN